VTESGGVSGLLGTDGESPTEGLTPEAPTPLDPTAAALAAEVAKNNPELAQEAAAYFRKQGHLVEIQTEHLHEQRAVNLQLLKLKRFGDRLRVGLQVFLILVATVIGIGVAVLIHDAITSRRVVIEPFDAPSALAARGVTGKVIASGLLGVLNRLQAATKSSAAKRDLTNAWSAEVELALPEAGVSIGALSRMLKRRFGHDVYIDGDLVQGETGNLELTVRGDGVPQKTFTGVSNELDKLTMQGAEYVYSQSEPALFATYLSNAGRDAEAIHFCQGAYVSASMADRPYLLNTWGIALQNTVGAVDQALALFRAAVKIKPDFWVGYNNIQNALWALGDEEGAWRVGVDMRRAAGGRPGRASEKYYQNADELTWNMPAWLNAAIEDAESTAGAGTLATSVGPSFADLYARMHDVAAAELALQTTKADTDDPTIEAITHFVRGVLAADAGDIIKSADEMDAFRIGYANPVVSSNYPGYYCWIAPAEEAAGHPDRADALLKTAGKFVDCYRFRADILDGRGDWPGAQKAYTEAVALAPDLPAAYYSWGVALAKHGDLVSAEAKLKDANKRGPHWADPLKAWGDLLAKQQGTAKDALAKYDEALKYAPNWKQLQEAREALAKQKT
jgi:tetratricopeptide (TPR) repeat protein